MTSTHTASEDFFCLCKNNIFAVPILHYNMETAAQVKIAFNKLKPDCVAVELAETMQLQLLHAASRLPDISVVTSFDQSYNPLYYLCEPCDAAFEGLRSALETNIPAYCIDLDVDFYPEKRELMPDPYSIQRIGLKNYYECCEKIMLSQGFVKTPQDHERELYMARRLKELSLSYDRILFISGMFHTQNVLNLVDRQEFPLQKHAQRDTIEISTVPENSCREILAEFGWISTQYELLRSSLDDSLPDRQRLIYRLLKEAAVKYTVNTGNAFPGYHMRNIMKFVRNYALLTSQLMPDLFQLLSAAKGCVDHNFAYEVWELATGYPHLRNVDNLPESPLTIEQIWGRSKILRFHMKQPSRKNVSMPIKRKDKANFRFRPPGFFSICSYPPEDVIVERFGEFLKKKGTQILLEESGRVIPFSNSLEDGLDIRETIRHWHEHKLYVKVKGKPPGAVGSVVVIFDEDNPQESKAYVEKYPYRTTWIGEHQQESDMAFYSTPIGTNVIGPGISRCEYGGFLMSYPPRRLYDIWSDTDYQECLSKSEVLLMASIDYAISPLIVYVAGKPPRSIMKSFAQRFGKKIVYVPIGQLSPITLNKIRVFHVLDNRDKRDIAGEYIF